MGLAGTCAHRHLNMLKTSEISHSEYLLTVEIKFQQRGSSPMSLDDDYY
jgi:hypothetical protein